MFCGSPLAVLLSLRSIKVKLLLPEKPVDLSSLSFLVEIPSDEGSRHRSRKAVVKAACSLTQRAEVLDLITLFQMGRAV